MNLKKLERGTGLRKHVSEKLRMNLKLKPITTSLRCKTSIQRNKSEVSMDRVITHPGKGLNWMKTAMICILINDFTSSFILSINILSTHNNYKRFNAE